MCFMSTWYEIQCVSISLPWKIGFNQIDGKMKNEWKEQGLNLWLHGNKTRALVSMGNES